MLPTYRWFKKQTDPKGQIGNRLNICSMHKIQALLACNNPFKHHCWTWQTSIMRRCGTCMYVDRRHTLVVAGHSTGTKSYCATWKGLVHNSLQAQKISHHSDMQKTNYTSMRLQSQQQHNEGNKHANSGKNQNKNEKNDHGCKLVSIRPSPSPCMTLTICNYSPLTLWALDSGFRWVSVFFFFNFLMSKLLWLVRKFSRNYTKKTKISKISGWKKRIFTQKKETGEYIMVCSKFQVNNSTEICMLSFCHISGWNGKIESWCRQS
jgi:hypothetical protein